MKLTDPADDGEHLNVGDEGGYASAEEPLDLGLEMAEVEDDDELLLGDGYEEPAAAEPAAKSRDSGPMDASARTEPARGWRPASGQAAVSVGGSTLFERMASLSRNRDEAPADDREEDDDAADLNIPRFLGRNNNRR